MIIPKINKSWAISIAVTFAIGMALGYWWSIGHKTNEVIRYLDSSDGHHSAAIGHVNAANSQAKEVELRDKIIAFKNKKLNEASAKLDKSDREYQALLKSKATDTEKLAKANEVITDQQEVISGQREVISEMTAKTEALVIQVEEWKQAYTEENKRAEDLKKSLNTALSIRKKSWAVGTSTNLKGSWGVWGDKYVAMFTVGGEVNQTQDSFGKKSFEGRVRLGIQR